jgi:glycosyltransferase involved in cell wall biosynthesis
MPAQYFLSGRVPGVHIVHVVESFGGGVIGFVEQLCRYLPQHRHTVLHAIRPAEVDADLIRARFPPYVAFSLWPHALREISLWQDAKALRALLSQLTCLKPDVVHLHSSKAGFLGRIACRMLGIKALVYTPGGVALLRKDISLAKRLLFGTLEAVGDLFGGVVVACGASEAKALEAYGVHPHIIANGTPPGSEPIPKKADSTPLTVLAMGRLTVQKNPAQFGRIAQALAADARFRFVWVGSGELEAALTSTPVTITGWMPNPDVKALLQEADIYMSTSVWEGLSLAVLEGMSAGLPLVLSACPGNVDVVTRGQNGFLFTTDDEAIRHLLHLADDAALRLHMGRASRTKLLAEHDVAQVAARYDTLYHSLKA